MDTFIFIAVAAVPILFAIVLHEVSHGWVASLLGDQTARQMGRLSLNPFKHIDPVGTVLVPGVLIMTMGVAFGWAKPVPVSWQNLRNPKQDMVLVAAAGPASNFFMLIFWGIVGFLVPKPETGMLASVLMTMAHIGIGVNLVLMLLNLIPLPPLDGGRIATGLLPMKYAIPLAKLERYGLFIIVALVLLLTQVFQHQVNTFLLNLLNFIYALFSL